MPTTRELLLQTSKPRYWVDVEFRQFGNSRRLDLADRLMYATRSFERIFGRKILRSVQKAGTGNLIKLSFEAQSEEDGMTTLVIMSEQIRNYFEKLGDESMPPTDDILYAAIYNVYFYPKMGSHLGDDFSDRETVAAGNLLFDKA